MMNPERQLQYAIALHQRGERDAAIGAYRQLLAQVPNHAPALANLASLLAGEGHREEALGCYQQALAAQPGGGEIWFNYGNALFGAGDHGAAIDAYRKAVRLRPRLGPAWVRLGRALEARGEAAEAERCYRRALTKLGFTRAARPLAELLARQGHDAQALALIDEAARTAEAPDPDLLYALALRLHLAGRDAEANAVCGRCLACSPGHGDALALTGLLAYQEGNFAATVARWEAAARADPRAWQPHLNLGVLYRRLGQPERAHEALETALTRAPDNPRVLTELAFFMIEVGHLGEAAGFAERMVRVAPGLAESHDLRGCIYTEQARHAEAATAFAQAHRLGDENPRILANALFASLYDDTLDAVTIAQRHRELATRMAANAGPAPVAAPTVARARPARPIRIGYLSPDLRAHPVGYFIAPVLAAQHGGHFEITCYADVARADEVTERCRTHSDHWRVSYGWSDEQLARRIRDDDIDVLVDLAGHTAGARHALLGWRLAPLQVLYLGYPGTSGRAATDCVVADAELAPPGSETLYSEQLLRLSRCFLCYSGPRDAPPVSAAPCARSGRVTFGCFNHLPKITATTVRLWGAILTAAPHTRLVLKARALGDPGTRERIRAAFTGQGIDPTRIELYGPNSPLAAFLAEYARVDLALDPIPYNGGTTTCDALWMGVPVLSLAGEHLHTRMGASILHHLGHPEWVSSSEEDYVANAIAFAARPERIIATRATLREQMRGSSLCNAAAFAADLEGLLDAALDERLGNPEGTGPGSAPLLNKGDLSK